MSRYCYAAVDLGRLAVSVLVFASSTFVHTDRLILAWLNASHGGALAMFSMLLCVALQTKITGHVASDQYGKYGIIRESDLASKISEFQQWATEVKKVNVEALAKWEEKELFAEFMEDYNTGTLPHRKYYDLMAYAQQQAMKAAKKGRTAGVRAHLLLHLTRKIIRRPASRLHRLCKLSCFDMRVALHKGRVCPDRLLSCAS